MEVSAGQLAREVVSTLRSHGYQGYLVGGCVRDLLLGIPPKDYDVTTDAHPEQVIGLFPDARLVGAHFGVVLVRREQAEVEVATFRSDHDYADGRRPGHVVFEKDPEQDVLRRDFTINALLAEPESEQILDYVGGRDDLEIGLIRAIGDAEARFREDHLRMLRAVRFAARLGFELESETESAVVRLAPLIQSTSAERVRDEIVRILTEGSPRRGFELLDRTHLLQQILPEVAAMKGVEQPAEFHPEGDVWIHTLLMLEGLKNPTPTLALGVLLHDVGKPPTFHMADRIRFDGHVEVGVEMTRQIMHRLRFSRDEIEAVCELVAHHMRFKDAPRMKDSTLKRFLRMERFEEHMELHRLDCESSHRMLGNYEFVRAKQAEFGQERIAPPPLLTGKDLIEEGYTPGPEFGIWLAAVEDAQLEGRISSKEEGLALVRLIAGEKVS